MSVEHSRVDRVEVRRYGAGWEARVFEVGRPQPIWTAHALTLYGVVALIEDAYPEGIRGAGAAPI